MAGTDGADFVTCTTVETCGYYVGGFLSAPVEYATVADITCKINIFKQSYFAISSFASPEYGCIFVLIADPSTVRDYPAKG